MDSHGVNENWCGGTSRKRNGRVLMFRTSRQQNYAYQPDKAAVGDDALAGDKPFIMHPDGVGWICVRRFASRPLPTHYEPLESIVENPLYPDQQSNPLALRQVVPQNQYADSDDRFRFHHEHLPPD